MAGLRFLLPMPHPRCYHRQRTVRGQSYWLGLLCRTLSFPTPSRFIPALSLSPSPPLRRFGHSLLEKLLVVAERIEIGRLVFDAYRVHCFQPVASERKTAK